MKVRNITRPRSLRGRARRLTPGRIVRGRVIASLGGNRFRINAAGLFLEASSDLDLEPGQPLFASVAMDGQQILLRILDDPLKHPGLFDEENDDEIRRVLRGLGHDPHENDIKEFRRRLDQCRNHGNLTGEEPSNVWIMAILLTRGLLGAANNFALISFFLRYLSWRYNPDTYYPLWEDVLTYLFSTDKQTDGIDNFSIPFQSNAHDEIPDIIAGDRIHEAVLLLNHREESAGNYRILSLPDRSEHIISKKNRSDVLFRWTNHPVQPDFVTEISRHGADISAFCTTLFADSPSAAELAVSFRRDLNDTCAALNLHLTKFATSETGDSEELRFKFWRKWI